MSYTDLEYEAMAIQTIKKYLNRDFTDEEIKSKYSLALKRLINNSMEMDLNKKIGVKSFSEGNQSVTFSDTEAWTITDDIKALLPTPYVRMW